MSFVADIRKRQVFKREFQRSREEVFTLNNILKSTEGDFRTLMKF